MKSRKKCKKSTSSISAHFPLLAQSFSRPDGHGGRGRDHRDGNHRADASPLPLPFRGVAVAGFRCYMGWSTALASLVARADAKPGPIGFVAPKSLRSYGFGG